MSASSRAIRSRISLSKDKSNSLEDIDRSLPIRTTITPNPKRPAPTTLQPNQQTPSSGVTSNSSSSASSCENSTRIFDDQPPLVRAESPTTPPESPLMLGNDTIKRSIYTAAEGSPLPMASRRSRKSPRVPVGDRTFRPPANHKNTLRQSGIHSAPPPLFPSSIRQRTATHSRSVSNPEGSIRSVAHPQVDVSGSGDASAKPDLISKDRPESITIPDSDEESDEYVSDANEKTSVTLPKITLGLGKDEEQQEEDEESDDGDVIMLDVPTVTDVSEDGPNVDCHDCDPLKFTRYGKEELDICSINETIIEAMKKTKNPKDPGWTYIFKSPTRAPGHLKVGISEHMNRRKKSLQKCFGTLIRVQDSDEDAFDFYAIPETLCLLEFHNRRKRVICDCKKTHKEWVEVTEDVLLKSVGRWRNWIKIQRPYDNEWKLTPYWEWKVKNLSKTISRVDWDDWTQPERSDYFWYWYNEFGRGYRVNIGKRFERKDMHFWLVGVTLLLCMHLVYGWACFMLNLVALILI